jgi:hypothetical protein
LESRRLFFEYGHVKRVVHCTTYVTSPSSSFSIQTSTISIANINLPEPTSTSNSSTKLLHQLTLNYSAMKPAILTAFAVFSAFIPQAASQASAVTKKDWTGQLSSLDGGLGGIVVVADTDKLVVNNYRLEDASAPALYWWGSKTSALGDGFRISNKQVQQAASSDTYTITLNAGKTTADFATVGLWCEKFGVNFGQATLSPPDGNSQAGGMGSSSTAAAPTGSAGAAAKANSGVANTVGRLYGGIGAALVAVLFQ